ncbi:MAG: ABC transporter substrate-binding protein [Deltaproteobacteria bacterium]|jgi:ABC-type branched-subunit amino acid transport system substrate-binding protein|nr:ABC transporter substrate-binding protein [Deltaproteobacteria bacterium]
MTNIKNIIFLFLSSILSLALFLIGTSRAQENSVAPQEPKILSQQGKKESTKTDKPSYIFRSPQPGASPALLIVAPLNGPWSVFGREAKSAADLALKSLGQGFEVIMADETELDFPKNLNNISKPAAVAGHLFEPNLVAAAPWYLKNKTPVILPFLDNPETKLLGQSFFRLLPDPIYQGRFLARFVPRGPKKIRKVFILEGPEESQKILAQAFREALTEPQKKEKTIKSPKTQLPRLRPLSAKQVETLYVENYQDLNYLIEHKASPNDYVLLALPSRFALKAASLLAQAGYNKSTVLAPLSLSIREIGAAYLALDFKALLVLVPFEEGSSKNPNQTLTDFVARYAQNYRQEPSWAAIVSYDTLTLAALASSSEEGPMNFLTDTEAAHNGVVGRYFLSDEGWPLNLIKVTSEKLYLLP